VIERDPATVFAFVSNLENEARFQPNVERVEKLTPGPIRAGTQFSARARLPASGGIGERVFDGIDEIVDYEPNHRLTSRTASGSHFNLDVKTFVPVSNRTLVTHRFQAESSYSAAMLGATLRFGPAAIRLLKANRTVAWTRAKEILESDGQTTT